MNGEALTMRPESTAGMRARGDRAQPALRRAAAALVHRPDVPPRAAATGRYRQFHQVGAEALGFAGPDMDAELIVMCRALWDDLGLQRHPARNQFAWATRPSAIATAPTWSTYLAGPPRRARCRFAAPPATNPLRILDTKNPAMQALIDGAPKLLDYLGDESRAHFEGVQALLREAGIPLPRSTRAWCAAWTTTIAPCSSGSPTSSARRARSAAAVATTALIEKLGGKPAPACGFAMGIERLLELIRQAQPEPAALRCDVYVVHQGDAAQKLAFRSAERLRDAGLDVILHCGAGNFKAQMRRADASGAELAVVIGDDEAASNSASIKWLRGEEGAKAAGEQRTVPIDALVETVIGAVVGERE